MKVKTTVVRYSDLVRSLRFDAEFYTATSLRPVGFLPGAEIIDLLQYGTSKTLNEDALGFPTLRLNEFDSLFIKPPQKHCDRIDAATFESLVLKKGDVLICRTNGNPKLVGKGAIVPEDTDYAFASYLFRVRPIHKICLPTTLVVYLASSFGRTEVEKHLMVSNQANFSPAKFREILVPQFGPDFQSRIDRAVWTSFDRFKKSKQAYSQVHTSFLSELGLADWRPQRRLSFVRNFSDTQHAKRFDADYFQPQFDDIISAIKSYQGGWDTLGNLVTISKSIEVGSEEYLNEGVPFVRVSNLSPFDISEEKYISKALYESMRQHQPRQGEILLSKDGTPGIAHYLREQPKEMIASSGILRLKSKTSKISNEYLTVVLNSMLTKEQANRDVGGSVILHWRPDQVVNLAIPILSQEAQTQIQGLVVESSILHQQSKHLLECAKRAVEIAIEQDEQTAIAFLECSEDRNKSPNGKDHP